jgi:hypothetical protein
VISSRAQSPANVERLGRLRHMLAEVLADVLQDGFYGSASIEIDVDNGTILNATRRVERRERFPAVQRAQPR